METTSEVGAAATAETTVPMPVETETPALAPKATTASPRPTIGRIVHYVYAASDLGAPHQRKVGVHRPAIVVNIAEPGVLNLQVFTDQANDGFSSTLWKQRVFESLEHIPGTWHWPEREG